MNIPLKKRAHEILLDRILSGEYGPGHCLTRRGLAEELGMSVAPVHEALLQLESEGFLEVLPRTGTRVRIAPVSEVRGHLILREAIESQAARMVCGKMSDSQLEPLYALADAVDTEDIPERQRALAEVAFHNALVSSAQCPALSREYGKLMQVGLFYRINLMLNMPVRSPQYFHRDLLQTLAQATPEEATLAVHRHIWSGKPDLLQQNKRNAS